MKEEIVENACLRGTETVVKRTVKFNVTKEQMEYLKENEESAWEIFDEIQEQTNGDDDDRMQVTNVEFEEYAARELRGVMQCIVTYSAE